MFFGGCAPWNSQALCSSVGALLGLLKRYVSRGALALWLSNAMFCVMRWCFGSQISRRCYVYSEIGDSEVTQITQTLRIVKSAILEAQKSLKRYVSRWVRSSPLSLGLPNATFFGGSALAVQILSIESLVFSDISCIGEVGF